MTINLKSVTAANDVAGILLCIGNLITTEHTNDQLAKLNPAEFSSIRNTVRKVRKIRKAASTVALASLGSEIVGTATNCDELACASSITFNVAECTELGASIHLGNTAKKILKGRKTATVVNPLENN